jgi:hypothetical protein
MYCFGHVIEGKIEGQRKREIISEELLDEV